MKQNVVQQNDKQLLRRLRAGDPHALNDAYKQYRVWLLLVASQYIPDIDMSNEAHITRAKAMVEEFFIECWDRNLFKDVRVPLRTFLFRSFSERCKKQVIPAPIVP